MAKRGRKSSKQQSESEKQQADERPMLGDIPSRAKGSGSKKNRPLTDPTPRDKVRNPDPKNPRKGDDDLPVVQVATQEHGHPNQELIPDSVADHHPPTNNPFGSQPQNLDPETGEVIPMDPEERRTGYPEGDPEKDEVEKAKKDE
jgi:hypothetical protein